MNSNIFRCKRCGLPETYKNITFDQNGICNYCHDADKTTPLKSLLNFDNEDELIQMLQNHKNKNGKYDVVVPLSGGVDSSATLIKIVKKYGLVPLAFHNDHGYEDPVATENVQKLCKVLDVDLIIKQQDIGFMRKLFKYTHSMSNKGLSSCFVCGGIIYANALEIAEVYDVPMVINGYSKGQALMMNDNSESLKLWAGLLREFQKDPEFFGEFMRKQRPMGTQILLKSKEDLKKPIPVDKHLVIPFYVFKFNHTDKVELQKECEEVFGWKKLNTTYPNRTTNCLMVWLNTYVDQCKLGYSMYDEEYAGIVRNGEMTREQAICDLQFKPPMDLIKKLADEVGTDLRQFTEN